MTVLLSAGPRTRLQLLRQTVAERAEPHHRYVVWLLDVTGPRRLHAGPRYQAAKQAFDMEADWRGWAVRVPPRRGMAA